jgi:hypothetical protein
MINIQDYVTVPRTGKAGLRLGSISSGTSELSLRPNQHSAPSFTAADVGQNIVVIGAGRNGDNLFYHHIGFYRLHACRASDNRAEHGLPGSGCLVGSLSG